MLASEDVERICQEIDSQTVTENSADFSMVSDGSKIFSTQNTVVKYPKTYLTESMIPVRSTDLSKAREKIEQINKPSPLITEGMLGISTTCLGLFLNIFFNLESLTLARLTWYFALLLAAIICFAVYFHLRAKARMSAENLAKQALEYLPSPEDCEEQEA